MRKFSIILLCIVCSMLLWGCGGNKADSNDTTNALDSSAQVTPNSDESNLEDADPTEIGLKLLNDELLFIFNNDTSSSEVIDIFGEPEEKSEVTVWGSDGSKHQTWYYHKDDIELNMKEANGIQVVESLKIGKNSGLNTSRNIRIGSTKEEIINAFRDDVNLNDINIGTSQIVVGSAYGGIVFQMENDKVTSIFIGASAE